MSGVRTRTGCYTCRLRKKKCDEQKPICQICRSRDIYCYGYGARPEWMREMRSWTEIMESSEAKAVRESAERTYRLRRGERKKRTAKDTDRPVATLSCDNRTSSLLDVHSSNSAQETATDSRNIVEQPDGPSTSDGYGNLRINRSAKLLHHHLSGWTPPAPTRSVVGNKMLQRNDLSVRSDMRLLMTFLDVIFPLQFGFYSLSGSNHRTWLLHTLIETEPLYEASLSVTISFEAGMHDSNQQGIAELDPNARILQLGALKGLQQRVDELSAERYRGIELLRRGMQTLAIMTQLLSLEVFTFLEGQWEMHLQAARVILGLFQHKWTPELFTQKAIASAFDKTIPYHGSPTDLKAFEFFITGFVWVDIIASASHGSPPFNSMHFNAISLLRNGSLKPQEMMGCQSCILIAIGELTIFEAWKNDREKEGNLSVMEMVSRAAVLNHGLDRGIRGLECMLCISSNNLKADSEAVNLIFAYAALVYLHTIVAGWSPHVPEIRNNVTRCLERFEVLPTRLLIRVCWPFTVAGCMATESQYDRFRRVVMSAREQNEPLGTVWKGLKVMEECWRLRKEEPGMWGWRSTMMRMNARILLI